MPARASTAIQAELDRSSDSESVPADRAHASNHQRESPTIALRWTICNSWRRALAAAAGATSKRKPRCSSTYGRSARPTPTRSACAACGATLPRSSIRACACATVPVAGRRCVDHANACFHQHERADNHDCGKGREHDPERRDRAWRRSAFHARPRRPRCTASVG